MSLSEQDTVAWAIDDPDELVERIALQWRAVMLQTGPTPRKRAERALRWIYRRASMKQPRIIWCRSPLAAAKAVVREQRRRDALRTGDQRPLAEGEATGHTHRVEEPDQAELYEDEGGRILLRILAGDVRVVHEEHAPVTLPAGDYEVRRVREYDHFAEEAREISD